eukprot:CFRG0400T1
MPRTLTKYLTSSTNYRVLSTARRTTQSVQSVHVWPSTNAVTYAVPVTYRIRRIGHRTHAQHFTTSSNGDVSKDRSNNEDSCTPTTNVASSYEPMNVEANEQSSTSLNAESSSQNVPSDTATTEAEYPIADINVITSFVEHQEPQERKPFELTQHSLDILARIPNLERKAMELLEIMPYTDPLPLLKTAPGLILHDQWQLKERYGRMQAQVPGYDISKYIEQRPVLLCSDEEFKKVSQRLKHVEGILKGVDLFRLAETTKRLLSIPLTGMVRALDTVRDLVAREEDVSTVINGAPLILTYRRERLIKRRNVLLAQEKIYDGVSLAKDLPKYPCLMTTKKERLNRLAYLKTLNPEVYDQEKIDSQLQLPDGEFDLQHGQKWYTRAPVKSTV